MENQNGKVVINDGVLYANGVFFLSKETIASADNSIKSALNDLYDIVSYN